MQNPEPPTSWKPSQSVVIGAVIGQATAQLVVAICDQFFSHPLSPELSAAISGFCVTLGTYFIPDKPRNS